LIAFPNFHPRSQGAFDGARSGADY